MKHLRRLDPEANPTGWADENKKAHELFIKASEECYVPAADAFKARDVPLQLLDRIREAKVLALQTRPKRPRRD